MLAREQVIKTNLAGANIFLHLPYAFFVAYLASQSRVTCNMNPLFFLQNTV